MTTVRLQLPQSLTAGEIVAIGVSDEAYMKHYAETHHEWIEGVVIKMSPVSSIHDRLTTYLKDLVRAYFLWKNKRGDTIELLVRLERGPTFGWGSNQRFARLTPFNKKGAMCAHTLIVLPCSRATGRTPQLELARPAFCYNKEVRKEPALSDEILTGNQGNPVYLSEVVDGWYDTRQAAFKMGIPSGSVKRVTLYEWVLLAMSELLAEMAEGKVK